MLICISDKLVHRNMTQEFPQVSRLLWVMAQLRDPNTGCPWDLQQSFQSIVPYTIEEAYEVADAIEFGSMSEVKDELGDLLFQVVFYAQLGKEQAEFDFEAIAQTVADKLIRRHPHVFSDVKVNSTTEVLQNWDAIKKQERAGKGENDNSILANIPKGMSPLVRAHKIQKRCAKVGFDWPEIAPVVSKVEEEIQEVLAEVNQPRVDQEALELEVGDLLFAVVNLARHVGVDAEKALRAANNKFEQRFRQVEQTVEVSGRQVDKVSLDELEHIWQQVKR